MSSLSGREEKALCYWSGTDWQDGYWPFCRMIEIRLTRDPWVSLGFVRLPGSRWTVATTTSVKRKERLIAMSIVAHLHALVVGVDAHARNHGYAILNAAPGEVVDSRGFPTTSSGINRTLV